MTTKEIRERQQYLRSQNHLYGDHLEPVPKPWPAVYEDGELSDVLTVYRSKRFFCAIFSDEKGRIRLSVNRTMIDGRGMWLDGITWEELQQIKNECGFEDLDAVEIYPRAGDEVNVANMRHLWILPKPFPLAWRNPR